MTSTEIININGEVCSGKMKGIHDGGECGLMSSPQPSPTGLRVPQKNEKHDEV